MTSITHKRGEELLELYHYQYDKLGLNEEILHQGNGREETDFHYRYDSLGRLTEVKEQGSIRRACGYDALGKRTTKREGNQQTSYTYSAPNQLIYQSSDVEEKHFSYDKRGEPEGMYYNHDIKKKAMVFCIYKHHTRRK